MAGIVLTGVGTRRVPARAAQAGDNEGLSLFAEMMPVFTSPRCANCHDGTNPVTGVNHEPGPVPDATRLSNGDMGFDAKGVCQECHTAGTAAWRTAPSEMAFFGRDTLTLCRQIRRTMAGDFFVKHIATDALIGVGFVGQGGIGKDSPFAPIKPDPPPMSRARTVAAAKRWVEQGQMKCGPNGWNGTITSTTTAQSHEDPQAGTRLVKDSAQELKVTLAVVDSTATANVSFTMHDFTDAPPDRPCWVIHYDWKADGRGDAGLQIIGDTDTPRGMFISWNTPAYSGTAHSLMATVPPACTPVQRDQPYVVQKTNVGVQPIVNPKDPNHVIGQTVIENPTLNTTTTIKWNLSRDP